MITAGPWNPCDAFQKRSKISGRKAVPRGARRAGHESIQAWPRRRTTAYGKIDILINNAGCNVRKPALEITWDDWNLVLDTNSTGNVLRGAGGRAQDDPERLRADREYRFGDERVRVCGPCAVHGKPGRREAVDHEPRRRLGSAWCDRKLPGAGLVPTEQNKVLYDNQEWVEYLKDRIPLRRPGQPDDLDGAVVFLASEESRYITGQTLLVDGGISTGATRATVAKKS